MTVSNFLSPVQATACCPTGTQSYHTAVGKLVDLDLPSYIPNGLIEKSIGVIGVRIRKQDGDETIFLFARRQRSDQDSIPGSARASTRSNYLCLPLTEQILILKIPTIIFYEWAEQHAEQHQFLKSQNGTKHRYKACMFDGLVVYLSIYNPFFILYSVQFS